MRAAGTSFVLGMFVLAWSHEVLARGQPGLKSDAVMRRLSLAEKAGTLSLTYRVDARATKAAPIGVVTAKSKVRGATWVDMIYVDPHLDEISQKYGVKTVGDLLRLKREWKANPFRSERVSADGRGYRREGELSAAVARLTAVTPDGELVLRVRQTSYPTRAKVTYDPTSGLAIVERDGTLGKTASARRLARGQAPGLRLYRSLWELAVSIDR